MWSFWSRDPSKDFGYEIGEIVTYQSDDRSIWAQYKGKKKVGLISQSTGEPVSLFKYEIKPQLQLSGDNHQMDDARNAVKRLKTLRHPSILTYIDSLEVF